jgi:hypothetical protein
MVTRSCIHCEAQIEVLDEARTTCPICGMDPDLPKLSFDDAPAFFFSPDDAPAFFFSPYARLEPVRVAADSLIR